MRRGGGTVAYKYPWFASVFSIGQGLRESDGPGATHGCTERAMAARFWGSADPVATRERNMEIFILSAGYLEW